MRILFVCLGNICRSPTAEGVLRHKLRGAGLAGDVDVESAGTGGWHIGHPPDQRATRGGGESRRSRSRAAPSGSSPSTSTTST